MAKEQLLLSIVSHASNLYDDWLRIEAICTTSSSGNTIISIIINIFLHNCSSWLWCCHLLLIYWFVCLHLFFCCPLCTSVQHRFLFFPLSLTAKENDLRLFYVKNSTTVLGYSIYPFFSLITFLLSLFLRNNTNSLLVFFRSFPTK